MVVIKWPAIFIRGLNIWLWLEGTELHAVFIEQLLAQFCPLSNPDVVVEMGEGMGSFWISIAWPTHSSSVPIYPFHFLEMKQTGLPWLPSRLSFPSAQVEPTSKERSKCWNGQSLENLTRALRSRFYFMIWSRRVKPTKLSTWLLAWVTAASHLFDWVTQIFIKQESKSLREVVWVTGVQHPQLTDIHNPLHIRVIAISFFFTEN